jgi:hypothetical protein
MELPSREALAETADDPVEGGGRARGHRPEPGTAHGLVAVLGQGRPDGLKHEETAGAACWPSATGAIGPTRRRSMRG